MLESIERSALFDVILDLDEAAAFALLGDLDLDGDAFEELFAVGDDADAAIALTGNLLELLEGGHDGFEAILVEGAETFVDEENVDVHVGTVQRGECEGQGQGDHEAFATREDGGASHLVLVVPVEDEDCQLLVVVAARELVAVGDLLEVDVGIVEQGQQDIGLHQGAETCVAEPLVQQIPFLEFAGCGIKSLFCLPDVGFTLLVVFKLRADASQLPRDVADVAFVFGDFPLNVLSDGSVFDTLDIEGCQC